MDGTGSLDPQSGVVLGTIVPNQTLPPEIASDLKAFGQRIESILAVLERGGACASYQTQIARALLLSLIDAVEDMGSSPGRA